MDGSGASPTKISITYFPSFVEARGKQIKPPKGGLIVKWKGKGKGEGGR
jgi:hypothetical protein